MKSNTKERIVDVAIVLFSQKGYAETSMRHIANDVGIKAASIYNYFLSKDEILATILNMMSQMLHEHRISREDAGLPLGKIDAETLLNRLFFAFPEEVNQKYRDIIKILYSESTRNEAVRAFLYDEIILCNYKFIKSELEQLSAQNSIKPIDTEAIASILNSITKAYSVLSNIGLNYMDENNMNTNMFYLLKYILESLVIL